MSDIIYTTIGDDVSPAFMSWDSARADSVQMVTDFFLTDPATGKPTVVTEVTEDPIEGCLNIICVDSFDADRAVCYKVFTGHIVPQSEVDESTAKILTFPTGGIVDVNGNEL